MAQKAVTAKIRDVEEALEGTPKSLQSGSSTESIRTSSGPGLAMLPFLTINDIIALRAEGFKGLQDIEERVLEVPDKAWDHVMDLVRAGIARVGADALVPPPPKPKRTKKAAKAAGSNGKTAKAKGASSKRAAGSDNGGKTADEGQPQCIAITKAAGSQCSNPSREGSKYCSSHKGWRGPKVTDEPKAEASGASKKKKAKGSKKKKKKGSTKKGTAKPKAKKATKKAKSAPKKAKSPPKKADEGQPQCIAITKAGSQCSNPSREGSKYCSSHKGWRGPKITD